MNGYSILIHDHPIGKEQFKFPRSKRFRIRKKWAKRPVNFRPIFMRDALIDHSHKVIICTSRMAASLRKATAG